MRKVRFLVAVADATAGYRKDQVVDMPDDEAHKWCDGERAVFADESPAPTQDEEEAAEEFDTPAAPAPPPTTRNTRKNKR